MLAERPAAARARLAAAVSNPTQRAPSAVGSEVRAGNAVGKVVGTALFKQRFTTITADGKHLESCDPGSHTHDGSTVDRIAQSAMATAVGGARE